MHVVDGSGSLSLVHSTREAGEPFSWTLGDGSVIEGLELAVGGGGGLPPMLVGGARRVIVPMARGFMARRRRAFQGQGGAVGPALGDRLSLIHI